MLFSQFSHQTIHSSCALAQSASSWMKYSISICSNSRERKMKLRGVISLRNDLPICAMPNGSFTRVVSDDVLEVDEHALRGLGAEVGDRRGVAHRADIRLEHHVERSRRVRLPGSPVAGEGTRGDLGFGGLGEFANLHRFERALEGFLALERLGGLPGVQRRCARSRAPTRSRRFCNPRRRPRKTADPRGSAACSPCSRRAGRRSRRRGRTPPQTFGCMMMEVSMPTTSSRRCTMSRHQQSRMLRLSSTPSGP